MTTQPAGKLAAKLAEVMAAVERIPKNGHNSFHHYDYATEADIVAAVRQELAARQVMLFPAITGSSREPVGDKGSVLTHLLMEFTFVDGESGEQITRPWLGAGTDKEDKGAYKAMTGGEKYFLLKTFLIPTGDDPENESDGTATGARQTTRDPEPRRQAAATAPRAATPAPRSGEIRVTTVRVAKNGTNAKGPWTLYAVKFSDGREGTTFSKSLYESAQVAAREGFPVDVSIDTKGNLVTMTAVYQLQEELETELG
jgi:hypothetical protein